jgi:hypothetical protein
VSAILILAHATDSGAESVAALAVRRLGPHAVRMVRPEVLGVASWSHRVDPRGKAATRILLPHGEPIEDACVGAILNRIRYLPVPRFHRASAKDRDYAALEMQALVASWLAGLGTRVVHVVREHPWLTPLLPPQHWAAPAAACGLPVAFRAVATSSRASLLRNRPVVREQHGAAVTSEVTGAAATVLVAGNRAGGPLSSSFGPHCLRTARMLGFPLLEFRFAVGRGSTTLVAVDPLPSLLEPWAAELTVDLLQSVAESPR